MLIFFRNKAAYRAAL